MNPLSRYICTGCGPFFRIVAGATGLVFGWIAFLPKLERMRSHHWTIAAFTALAVIAFYVLLFTSAKTIGNRYGPWLEEIEASGPQ